MPVGNQRTIRALAAALLLIPGRLIAQVQPAERAHLPIEDGTDIVFVRVPFGNGSSHTTVTQIASDPSGFLWFGTNDGLKRYDGYRIRDFKPDSNNRNSLSGLSVETVFQDRSGRLWVASDLTVDRYDPVLETFTHYPSDPATLEGPVRDPPSRKATGHFGSSAKSPWTSSNAARARSLSTSRCAIGPPRVPARRQTQWCACSKITPAHSG